MTVCMTVCTVCMKALHYKRFSGLATNRTNRHKNGHTNRARRLGSSCKPYKPYTKGAYFPTPQIVTVCTVCTNSLSAVPGLYNGLVLHDGGLGLHAAIELKSIIKVQRRATSEFVVRWCPGPGDDGVDNASLHTSIQVAIHPWEYPMSEWQHACKCVCLLSSLRERKKRS